MVVRGIRALWILKLSDPDSGDVGLFGDRDEGTNGAGTTDGNEANEEHRQLRE